MITSKEKQSLDHFKKSAQLRKIAREKRIHNIKTAGLWDSLKSLLSTEEKPKKSEEERLKRIQEKLIDVSGRESTAERHSQLGRQRLERIRNLPSRPPPPPGYLPPISEIQQKFEEATIPANEESLLTPEPQPQPRPTPEIPSIIDFDAPGRKPFRGEKRPTMESLTRKPRLSKETLPTPSSPTIVPPNDDEEDYLNAPELPQRVARRSSRLNKLAKLLG